MQVTQLDHGSTRFSFPSKAVSGSWVALHLLPTGAPEADLSVFVGTPEALPALLQGGSHQALPASLDRLQWGFVLDTSRLKCCLDEIKHSVMKDD